MRNGRRITALVTGVLLGSIAVIATLVADVLAAEEASVTLSPKALEEVAQVEAEIDRIEAQTLERLAVPPDNQVQQIELLGKALLYDKNLSVNRNQACAFSHMPETGFAGPIFGAQPHDWLLSAQYGHASANARRKRMPGGVKRAS